MNQIKATMAQPLPEAETIEQLNRVLGTVTQEHLLWISGYCYGLAQNHTAVSTIDQNDSKQRRIWVLYGSQTGNSKIVAESLASTLRDRKHSVELKSMADLQPRQLKNCEQLFAVVSTQGEGEPPEQALGFFEALNSAKAPDLGHLSFSVLGLGDSSYEYFCETAKQLDSRLEQLKALRLFERIDADIDYQQQSKDWIELLSEHVEQLTVSTEQEHSDKPELKLVAVTSSYSASKPLMAEILTNQRITASSSNKLIKHLELDITNSGISYQPGDALGVLVHNSEQQIEQIVSAGKLQNSLAVQVNGEKLELEKALKEKCEITRIHPKVIEKYALNNVALAGYLAHSGREALLKLSSQYQLIDLLSEYPVNLDAQQLVDLLQPKAERLYSIASSAEVFPDEIHLTVAAVEYQHNKMQRYGTGSQYLNHTETGGSVAVYLQENHHFRLPANTDTPIIMVGPGTGIAPFRSFMQQRDLQKGNGKNWLFFGEQHFHSDFLYQLEWQKLLKKGSLDRLDVAFSRDQQQKIYVQDRLTENARDIYDWLEQGAVFYICGDAKGMAKAVENSLLNIIAAQSAKDSEFAKSYLSNMKNQKRFLKDVY